MPSSLELVKKLTSNYTLGNCGCAGVVKTVITHSITYTHYTYNPPNLARVHQGSTDSNETPDRRMIKT